MRRHHGSAHFRFANLDDVPFALSEIEQLQIKVNVGNQLIALGGLPTIQARGREMIETAKARVFELVNAAYGQAEHAEWLDWKQTQEDARW